MKRLPRITVAAALVVLVAAPYGALATRTTSPVAETSGPKAAPTSEEPDPPAVSQQPTTLPKVQSPEGGTATHAGKPIFRLPDNRREVVLTFDDGPGAQTHAILAILAAEKVPAAFFWIAGSADPQVARDVVSQGHQLGTHTMNHANLTTLTRSGREAELTDSVAVLKSASGRDVTYCRPPYGAWNDATLQAAQEHGLSVVLWNVDARDWEPNRSPDQILETVLQEVRDGSIILLHERPQTVQVLPRLIRTLRSRGYSFVRLP